MKATLTYRCDEPGHEQTFTLTAEGDFDKVGETITITGEFAPDLTDDTSDPTGLHC